MANFKVFKSTINGNFLVGSSLVSADTSPDLLDSFTTTYNANPSSYYTSPTRTISGLSYGTTTTFTVTNGTLLVNSVDVGSSGTVTNGDVIQLYVQASADYLTSVLATLALNEEFATSWVVQTYAQPIDLSPGDAYAGSDLLYNLIRAGTPLQWW